MTHRIGTLGFAAALLLATSARAQISAPPTLQGKPSVHAWTVPGVMNNGILATAFACTNTLASTVIVGVEVFNADGGGALNDASTTSIAVGPGATRVFVTTLIAGFASDSNLAGGAMGKGSARVLTTTTFKASQRILCTAILADAINDAPISMTSLPVIRKITQQGD